MPGSTRSLSSSNRAPSITAHSPTTPLLSQSIGGNTYGSSGVEVRIEICDDQPFDPDIVPAYVAFNGEDGIFDSSSALSQDEVFIPQDTTGAADDGIDYDALKVYLKENKAIENDLASSPCRPTLITRRDTHKSQTQSILSQVQPLLVAKHPSTS
ncbi:hypothetical protein K493DRAFT_15241 [Basidiobolus meristosporus CBS 931.73]|uniref:Uncharacterized protein n=1 Tax=Basidiobolus meristosporus CBS 931.73 TaxID=1314790 RepID=A0A1Y1YH42_9FUNG|nr:hypothetical protein K493DRAFT_15241 [Basidiobolus meristosporus CBS 931.73]|eukprot:ORX97268.1 hypothetical protein K493DRAFT_15241 [Basidiobolus meristosporus CBS 931.73]